VNTGLGYYRVGKWVKYLPFKGGGGKKRGQLELRSLRCVYSKKLGE